MVGTSSSTLVLDSTALGPVYSPEASLVARPVFLYTCRGRRGEGVEGEERRGREEGRRGVGEEEGRRGK